jgi:hypothetical protein
MAVFSDDNVFWMESGANLLDEGVNNTIVTCDPMTFDLASAPSPGCN